MNREYPFTAWVLGGTFIPKEVKLVKMPYNAFDFHRSECGKDYSGDQLFTTKLEAIRAGREKLIKQEEKIIKQKEGIAKKRANLDKHDD